VIPESILDFVCAQSLAYMLVSMCMMGSPRAWVDGLVASTKVYILKYALHMCTAYALHMRCICSAYHVHLNFICSTYTEHMQYICIQHFNLSLYIGEINIRRHQMTFFLKICD
jgi:hypothetical protein